MYSSSVIEGLTLTNLGGLNFVFGGLSPQSPPLASPLVHTSKDFLNIKVFSTFANHYGLNEELLKCEFTVFTNQYWKKNSQLNTMLDNINFIEPHKVVYIELYKAYKIACTIPVTTAETERSF